MKKKEIIRCLQACVNEQATRPWAQKRGIKVKKVFDDIFRFDKGTTQGHIGIKGNKLYVIFAGSDSREKRNADWWGEKGNFNFGLIKVPVTQKIEIKAKVHAGALNAYKEVKKNIIEIINKNLSFIDKIYVTGQSKGGAIAGICAENLAFIYKYKDVYFVDMSGNKTGNKEFINLLIKHIKDHIKIWCERDPVPFVPLWLQGYRQPPNCKILKRTDIKGIKRFFWNLLPFHTSSHYPDIVLTMAKKQLK